ncbi:hypothetical protein GWK47_024217 [Chionoecetes opilio]|uniref:Uncharacterized protein n=1 Tax=Chionoecetes opilio TaxID=41210 RepID=A0A8J4XNN6_CHIOP|nr:hypothetical protein GWK47_024217 [Chionoecetes opilio]
MENLAKQDNCGEVRAWSRSISNHLYWCASPTRDGNPDMMLAKWLSIDDHIHNVHDDHHSDLFPKCQHDEIDEYQASEKLSSLLTNKGSSLMWKKLSPLHQTLQC